MAMKAVREQRFGCPAELEVRLRGGSWRTGRTEAEGLMPRGSGGRWEEVGLQVPRSLSDRRWLCPEKGGMDANPVRGGELVRVRGGTEAKGTSFQVT